MAKIICPNCGKKSENPYNCDHCGSMLVQFAAKGIGANELYETFRGRGKDEGKKPFCFTDDYIFPALKAELTACYNYAKDYPPKQPKCALSMSKSVYSSQVDAIQLSNAYFYIGCVFYQNEMHQLLNVIVFNDGRIDSFSKPSSEVKYLLDNLFHHEVDGRKITYFCDCGEDIDGATRLMSYLIQQRVHIAETAPLIFKTSIDGQFKKLSSEKCPVCGKDAHGDFSCEHCGSMLLQFERRGINYNTSVLKTIEPLGNLQSCIEEGMARCTSDYDVKIKIDNKVVKNLSGRDDMQENLLDVMARISIEIRKDEEDQRQTNIYVALERKNIDDVNNQTIEEVRPIFDKPLHEFARRFKLANMFYTEFVKLSPKEYGFKFSTCCGQDVIMAAKFATGILKAYDDLNVLDTLTDVHFVAQTQPTENEYEIKNEQATESSSVADNGKATSTQVAQSKTAQPESAQANVRQTVQKQPVENNSVPNKLAQNIYSKSFNLIEEISTNPWKWVTITLIVVLLGGVFYLMRQNSSTDSSTEETYSSQDISDAADANYAEAQEYDGEYEEEGDADVEDQDVYDSDSETSSQLAGKQAEAISNGEWWEGSIGGKYDLRMYINEETGEFWYYYTRNSSDNRLYLNVIENDDNHLVLLETNKNGNDTGKFDGYINGDIYSGTFYNLYNGKTFGFTLKKQ